MVFASGAAARVNAHRRHGHVEVHKATTYGVALFGKYDGYDVGVSLEDPHIAVLFVQKLDEGKSQTIDQATYGAHYQGSVASGRVTASFGSIGSVSLRFRPGSKKPHFGHVEKHCTGAKPRSEAGSFVGHVELHGEGGYFDVSADGGRGELRRTFTERCRVSSRKKKTVVVESLREAVEPPLGLILLLNFSSSLSTFWATGTEGGRQVLFHSAHLEGTPAGAETIATAFEYQGKMPVGRFAWVPSSPAGSLVTSLPGERPATATVKSVAPFSGEAEYVGVSSDSHEWTGNLAVQFPGLAQPLTGPHFGTSLCVASTLIARLGCDYVEPNFKGSEAEAAAASLPAGVSAGSPRWGPLLEGTR